MYPKCKKWWILSLVTSFIIRTVSSGGSRGPTGDYAPVDTSFWHTYSIPIIIDGLYDVLNSPRQLESVFKQLKSFLLLRTWSPGPSFSQNQNFLISVILISIHTWTWAWECSFLNHVLIKFMLASNMHQKALIILLHLSKGFSFWGTLPCFTFSKTKQFPDIKIFNIDLFMNVSNWTWSRTMHIIIYKLSFIWNVCLKYAPKWMVSSLIFQKFSREGLTESLPRPFPRFFRVSPSPSVRASPSILMRFAPLTLSSPSILGRFAPSIRASPSTFD